MCPRIEVILLDSTQTVLVKLSKLKPDTKNARKHSERNVEEIARSLEKFGQHRPFVVQKSTGKILIGNGMYEAMKQLGRKEGFALYVDDDDETAVKRALADNRTGELAEWDWPVLKDIVQEFGPEPDIPGWNDEELADLFDLSGWNPKEEISEDEAPEATDESVSKPGDLWMLGSHRLICGDSTDSSVIGILMGAEKSALVFTDPPYNVNYADKNKFLNKIDKGNRNQDEIENDNFGDDEAIASSLWLPVFRNLLNVSRDDCSIYVTMPQGGAHMMMMMAVRDAGWQVKHEIIWLKNNHVLGRSDYFYKHEPILYGWKKRHKFYGKGEFNTSIWEVDKPLKNDLHPTMKPVRLIENALMGNTEKDDIVIDAFGGSGSTLIACEQTGRTCRMAELDPRYCDVIVKRWQNLTGKEAVHEKTGATFNSLL
jgi:DNA modification methylase